MAYQIYVSGAVDEEVFERVEDAVTAASRVWNLSKEQQRRLAAGETVWVDDSYDPEGVLLWIERVEG